MTITRPHHPFNGKTLDVFRHARRQGRLLLVLILPDGSRSLIPADWTDLRSQPGQPSENAPFASQEDLLRLRALADALLNRAPAAAISVREEAYATTRSAVCENASSGSTSMGTTGPRTKTNRRRDALPSPRQSHSTGKAKGASNP